MREPFIIGHAMKPRCFKKKSGADLGFYYRSNNKALMTSVIFREWLHELDVDMEQQRRKIILLLDNASSHMMEGMDLGHRSLDEAEGCSTLGETGVEAGNHLRGRGKLRK
ncbi:hypothetical protein PC128_g17949 [Phytophthora cactorum]|nr:hypothetical protein PC128_g17949 [Phytophthora cactorum]